MFPERIFSISDLGWYATDILFYIYGCLLNLTPTPLPGERGKKIPVNTLFSNRILTSSPLGEGAGGEVNT